MRKQFILKSTLKRYCCRELERPDVAVIGCLTQELLAFGVSERWVYFHTHPKIKIRVAYSGNSLVAVRAGVDVPPRVGGDKYEVTSVWRRSHCMVRVSLGVFVLEVGVEGRRNGPGVYRTFTTPAAGVAIIFLVKVWCEQRDCPVS